MPHSPRPGDEYRIAAKPVPGEQGRLARPAVWTRSLYCCTTAPRREDTGIAMLPGGLFGYRNDGDGFVLSGTLAVPAAN